MPVRILITTDAVGGVWQYTRDLVQALSQAGHSLLVCVLGPAATSQQLRELQHVGRNILVEQNTGALEWMPEPWQHVDAAGDWLLRQAKAFKADIVHLNSYSYAALRWETPLVVVAHSCVGTWWRSVHGSAPGPEWGEYSRRVKLGLQSADAVVAPSAALAADLGRCYGLNVSCIKVIHNAISVIDHDTPTANKEPFCLAAGRLWDEAKNLALLRHVAERSAWPIYVAGDGGAARDTRANIRHLGKLSHPEFLGCLQRASLFLHPALYEPFGLVVLEAARFGCALLLSDIPSMRELWNGAARFLPPRDPDAWVAATDRLKSDYAARADLSARATHQSRRYTQAAQLREYRNLYGELLQPITQKQAAAV